MSSFEKIKKVQVVRDMSIQDILELVGNVFTIFQNIMKYMKVPKLHSNGPTPL